jgi:hypothetical protein
MNLSFKNVNVDEIEPQSLLVVSDEDLRDYLRFIHTQLITFRPKIEEKLKKIAQDTNNDPSTFPPLIELNELIQQLGPPPNEKRQKMRISTVSDFQI